MEGQTKLHSFFESIFNIIVGFGINLAGNLIILPMFGFKVSLSQAFGIGMLFTLISIARSYIIRRWFNKIMIKMYQK
jgi:hypothetical protein